MTALDTNVLRHYLVGDVPQQAEAARVLIDGLTPDEPGYICREVAWVLERSYGFTRRQVAEALMDLTASDTLVVENSDDVAAAAYRFRQGGVGFSDLMILRAAERANSTPLQTFDQTFARMQGVNLVETARWECEHHGTGQHQLRGVNTSGRKMRQPLCRYDNAVPCNGLRRLVRRCH